MSSEGAVSVGGSGRDLAYEGRERHPLVEAFLDRRWRAGAGVAHHRAEPCLDIAAADEMFAYALTEQHQHRGQALVSYLRSGLTASETLLEILDWRFGSAAAVPSLLDFASGYGRTTRFLVAEMPSERITIGEITRQALDFQRSRFSVGGILSDPRPERVDLGGEYGAVTALSLFTHLPEKQFSEWLARLWQSVASGGVLVFSVNDEKVLFDGSQMSVAGILFEPVSESHSLETDDYGSTWVTDRFVRDQIQAHCPGAAGCYRIERGLWHFQDLYIVGRSRSDDTVAGGWVGAPQPQVRLPPEGYLDTCILLGRDRLQVAGWAIDRLSPQSPPDIRVLLNGQEVGVCRADQERRDLAEPLGPEFQRSGWVCQVKADGSFRPHDTLLVEARGVGGRSTVLHLSEVEGADLTRRVAGALEETKAQNLHLRAEKVGLLAQKAELEHRIAAMERSRFWKLRNAWFRLRRLFR